MEGRSELARVIARRRNEIADELRLSLTTHEAPSALLIRSLIASIGRAVTDASPDPVVAWAQMVRSQHPIAPITALIEAAADRIVRIGEGLDLDYSALVVFVEIVKSSAIEALSPRAVSAKRPYGPSEPPSEVIQTVLAMLKARDEATCAHSQATGAWCRRLAEQMNLPPATTELIVQAGVLHDIGKIATPDSVLLKPGPLDEAEWVIMRRHAAFGADILQELPSLARCATIVRAHHERIDGAGYPDGLKGEEIPFEARVVAVADAFHAMISARPYRAPIGQREALDILKKGSGTQWDPTVVSAMVEMLEKPRREPVRDARVVNG